MDEFYIVAKCALPKYFELVLQAKSLVDNENMKVSDACKQANISRSTFYKYKDKISPLPKEYGKRSVISIKALDTKGVLSEILKKFYSFGCNVVSLNQAVPINKVAFITASIELGDDCDLTKLVEEIKGIQNVKNAFVAGVE